MDKYEDLKIVNFSFGKIVLTSLITAISGSVVTIFKLDDLSSEIKIIIVLCIFLIVFSIDLILLFVREREITYELRYLKDINSFLKKQTDKLNDEIQQNTKNIQSFSEALVKFDTK